MKSWLEESRSPCQWAARSIAALGIVIAVFTTAGCASYTLKGKVIAGDISYIAVVDANDDRLAGPGLAGVSVTMETDPGKLNHDQVGDTVSGSNGDFSIPVQKLGAGILIYDVGVEARRKGYEGVSQMFRLPPSSRRVLIMLRVGADALPPKADTLLEQYDKFKGGG